MNEHEGSNDPWEDWANGRDTNGDTNKKPSMAEREESERVTLIANQESLQQEAKRAIQIYAPPFSLMKKAYDEGNRQALADIQEKYPTWSSFVDKVIQDYRTRTAAHLDKRGIYGYLEKYISQRIAGDPALSADSIAHNLFKDTIYSNHYELLLETVEDIVSGGNL